MPAGARALCRRPQAGRSRAQTPSPPRRPAEPDHHRRAQVRHDEHPPLPGASSRDRHVEAQGAQLLRRRAQLGPRPRLVPRPLRRALRGARRVLSALHEPPLLRGRPAAHPRAHPGRQADLHGARPDLPDPLPLVPRRRRRLRDPADGGGARPRRPDLRDPLPLLDAAAALPRALRPLPDRDHHPGGAADGPRGHDAQGLRASPASTTTSTPSSSAASGRSPRPRRPTSTSSWRS